MISSVARFHVPAPPSTALGQDIHSAEREPALCSCKDQFEPHLQRNHDGENVASRADDTRFSSSAMCEPSRCLPPQVKVGKSIPELQVTDKKSTRIKDLIALSS